MKTNRLPREANMRRKWSTVMALLAILLGLVPGSVFVAPLAAQEDEPVPDPDLTWGSRL